MKYTRKEIDKTGKQLLSSKNQEEYDVAIEKLNGWRALHLVPLDILQQRIEENMYLYKRYKHLQKYIYKIKSTELKYEVQ